MTVRVADVEDVLRLADLTEDQHDAERASAQRLWEAIDDVIDHPVG